MIDVQEIREKIDEESLEKEVEQLEKKLHLLKIKVAEQLKARQLTIKIKTLKSEILKLERKLSGK